MFIYCLKADITFKCKTGKSFTYLISTGKTIFNENKAFMTYFLCTLKPFNRKHTSLENTYPKRFLK